VAEYSVRLLPGQFAVPIDERITEIAWQYDVTDGTVKTRISRARTRLFGRVTDQAIYQKLKRDGYLAANDRCQFPGCENKLPWPRRTSRKFCLDSNRHRAHLARHPELMDENQIEDDPIETVSLPNKPEPPAEPPAELTERERWILDVMDFRTQTGLHPEDVAPGFAIGLEEFERATEKRRILQAQ
jgi:hypothetical protein